MGFTVVTGSMQSGKQELGHVFTSLGYRWLDLNIYADLARAESSPHRPAYESLGLTVGLLPDGTETGIYYQKLAHINGLHRQVQKMENDFILQQLLAVLQQQPKESRVVASWGYLYQLLPYLPSIENVIVFKSDRRTWLDRIQRRAVTKGLPPLSDEQILGLATTIEMDPDQILSETKHFCQQSGSPLHVVDTSLDDWGESELRRLLAA